MQDTDAHELVLVNDRRLECLIRATGCAVEKEIERLIVEFAQPLVGKVVRHATGHRNALARHDLEDLAGAIHLRLVMKLRAVPLSPDEAIRDLERYVARLAYNAVNDHFRAAFPEWTRLKNRVRYSLHHDPRLALWTEGERMVAGLASWREAAPAAESIDLDAVTLRRVMRDRDRLPDALVAIFTAAGTPVVLDEVVRLLTDTHEPRTADVPAERGAPQENARASLRALWPEIRELRPMQRKALLLNLRSSETDDVASLLMLTGVASIDEVAAALEMTPGELAVLWNDLPLDDLRIAEMLHLTRQQVINLRRSARERLARRLARRGMG